MENVTQRGGKQEGRKEVWRRKEDGRKNEKGGTWGRGKWGWKEDVTKMKRWKDRIEERRMNKRKKGW